jgi:hypothetical protein
MNPNCEYARLVDADSDHVPMGTMDGGTARMPDCVSTAKRGLQNGHGAGSNLPDYNPTKVRHNAEAYSMVHPFT